MRTSFLQDLYLQRPITLVILICTISVLPWIGLGDFSTKGEPREASVAVAMLETGNYILPQTYADEFAYKPPMAHWLMALFSLPQGYVSEFTARLPSALAFIVLIISVLVFFGKRSAKFQQVFITVLILITCIEIHRAGMTTRVDMLLTTFTVTGLFQLYRWEEKQELKGLPVFIPILLGCATLTKGLVGIVLPLFIFCVYLLMLNKYSLLAIFKALVYAGVSSLFFPLLWYIAAWKQGGEDFLEVILAESFGRFFRVDMPEINYEIGHENGFFYNFQTLFLGFFPWTILLVFSIFGMKIKKPAQSVKEIVKNTWNSIRSMEKARLFSLVAIVCIIFFYSIPSSKRSVYLMPAYPFIALFLAQYFLYLTEYRTKVTRFFSAFLTTMVSIVMIVILLIMTGWVDFPGLISQYTEKDVVIRTVYVITSTFAHPSALTCIILGSVLFVLGIQYYQLLRKINIKILYAAIGLMFVFNILIDGVIMKDIRKHSSCRSFAAQIMREYPLNKENIFVMNVPKDYKNLYGLNFYLGNIFHDFEDMLPESGYFLGGEKDMINVLQKYGSRYTFSRLTSTAHVIDEIHQKIVLSKFVRK